MKNTKKRASLLSVIAYVMIVAGFCSCAENYNPPTFPEERRMEGRCLTDDLLISYAYGMCVDDDYIYVLALSDNRWVQIYDKESGTYLGSFVGRGSGPGEVSMGQSMTLSKDKKHLYVYDQAQQRLVMYSVSKSAGMPALAFEESGDFYRYNSVVRDVWPLQNSFLVNGQLGEQDGKPKRFQLLQDNRIMTSYNDFPVEKTEQQLDFLSPRICFSPSYEKMATGILFGGIMEIFDLSDENISLKSLHYFYEPNVRYDSGTILPNAGMRFGFVTMCATEERIYTVLIGDESTKNSNHVSVFDWDGNGVVKYHTGQSLFKLAMSDIEQDKLYALTFEPGEGFSLYVYELDKI